MDSDDDDIYEPDEATGTAVPIRTEGGHGEVQMADARDDEEEGEEVEDDSDDVHNGSYPESGCFTDQWSRTMSILLQIRKKSRNMRNHRESSKP